jgi:hypothetical protein
VPEKVKGHKKISEIPDVPKAIANLTKPLLTACRKTVFVYPIEALNRAKRPFRNWEAMPQGLWLLIAEIHFLGFFPTINFGDLQLSLY